MVRKGLLYKKKKKVYFKGTDVNVSDKWKEQGQCGWNKSESGK